MFNPGSYRIRYRKWNMGKYYKIKDFLKITIKVVFLFSRSEKNKLEFTAMYWYIILTLKIGSSLKTGWTALSITMGNHMRKILH